jgi:hypothetical protein
MIDYRTVQLLHRHGDADWVPMHEESGHDSAERDPERAWLRGGKIFKCDRCDESIAVRPATDPAPGDETGIGG